MCAAPGFEADEGLLPDIYNLPGQGVSHEQSTATAAKAAGLLRRFAHMLQQGGPAATSVLPCTEVLRCGLAALSRAADALCGPSVAFQPAYSCVLLGVPQAAGGGAGGGAADAHAEPPAPQQDVHLVFLDNWEFTIHRCMCTHAVYGNGGGEMQLWSCLLVSPAVDCCSTHGVSRGACVVRVGGLVR